MQQISLNHESNLPKLSYSVVSLLDILFLIPILMSNYRPTHLPRVAFYDKPITQVSSAKKGPNLRIFVYLVNESLHSVTVCRCDKRTNFPVWLDLFAMRLNNKLKVACKLLYPVLFDKSQQGKVWLLITYEDLLGLDLLSWILNPLCVDQITLFLVHVAVDADSLSVMSCLKEVHLA